MLLAVDIGNTNISLGLFKGRRLKVRKSIPTKASFYIKGLKALFHRYQVEDVIICSVVPLATNKLKDCLRRLWKGDPLILGKDIQVPIKNLYRKPAQVGQDRLVNAYAGASLYGVPLVVADFGTAVTFDVISKNKEYLGGIILPGLKISLDALAERTALLPKIKLAKPREFIGGDTEGSILSGVVLGSAFLSDRLIVKLRQRIGKSLKVIGTGGDISLMRKFSEQIKIIDPDLTLKGLRLIFERLAKCTGNLGSSS